MTAKYLWDLIYTSLDHRTWIGREGIDWLSVRYGWKLYHGATKKNWYEGTSDLAIKAHFKLHTWQGIDLNIPFIWRLKRSEDSWVPVAEV